MKTLALNVADMVRYYRVNLKDKETNELLYTEVVKLWDGELEGFRRELELICQVSGRTCDVFPA